MHRMREDRSGTEGQFMNDFSTVLALSSIAIVLFLWRAAEKKASYLEGRQSVYIELTGTDDVPRGGSCAR